MEQEKYDKVSEPIVAPYPDTVGYTIPRSGLQKLLSSIQIEDIPLDVKYLVDKLASANPKKETVVTTHSWDNYQLSAEVIAMAPQKRKKVYGDYDAELTSILEEKYR